MEKNLVLRDVPLANDWLSDVDPGQRAGSQRFAKTAGAAKKEAQSWPASRFYRLANSKLVNNSPALFGKGAWWVRKDGINFLCGWD
jgi:hypothetical protein